MGVQTGREIEIDPPPFLYVAAPSVDVYKRQGKKEYTADRLFTTILSSCFAWTSAIAVTLLFYFALFYPMEVKSEWKWVMLLPLLQSAARLLLVTAVPVSYTHLDVYKRQIL